MSRGSTKASLRFRREINEGKEFGFWIPLEQISDDSNLYDSYLLCCCRCGIKRKVSVRNLLTGGSSSCGCHGKENIRKLRELGIVAAIKSYPEHYVWKSMVNRCHNPKDKDYKRYGARGITVCDEWHHFHNFICDMGFRPSDRHSIERKDNNKGYCKSNCIWAEISVQANNRRGNKILFLEGVRITVKEIVRRSGIKRGFAQKHQKTNEK